MEIEWRKIQGYDNYEVSNMGKIRNIKTGKERKLSVNTKGYVTVGLSQGGYLKIFSVHTIVANAFLENPNNRKVVDHINNIKHDNRVMNLRWCTVVENRRNIGIQRNNTSGVKGVSWDKQVKKWQATISIGRKNVRLGWYTNLEEAKQARLRKANELFGEFVNACEKL